MASEAGEADAARFMSPDDGVADAAHLMSTDGAIALLQGLVHVMAPEEGG